MKEFVFGTFIYEYKHVRQNRKTLSLTVTPDLLIVLKSPERVDRERIEIFLKKKWLWLEKQLTFFKKYQRKIYKKEYITGEEYFYLGRQYRLIVKKSKEEKVVLTKGLITVKTLRLTSDSSYNRKLIDTWFLDKTQIVFKHRFDEMLCKFDYKERPKLSIREMKKRWGSFLNQNQIVLNPKLIHTSRECIDYVITHELCHMKYKNHDKKFFKHLSEKYPKWKKTKEKLELMGATIR